MSARIVLALIIAPMIAPLVSFMSGSAHAAPSVALVYTGPGACPEGCANAAAKAAKLAGFRVRWIGPDDLNSESNSRDRQWMYRNAVVWIQPGGTATEAINAMTPELKDSVREFVRNGGGYVGFCAGAFAATAKVGTTSVDGFGVFPGRTEWFENFKHIDNKKGVSIEDIEWNGSLRHVYYEGGPVLLDLPARADVSAFATYDTGHVASASAHFGNGRVFLTGLHPEAPARWSRVGDVNDADGEDHDLAAAMIRGAAGIAGEL